MFILPSTYVNGNRDMRQNMRNIFAISDKGGYPDIFLTISCSRKWAEIKKAIIPGQSVVDSPDIYARVICIKLPALMESTIDWKVFRDVKNHGRVT